jgi:N-acetylglucosaminyldiphosphoundecaprenol N-acetyl-beta-D-mannosaminyltransferase
LPPQQTTEETLQEARYSEVAPLEHGSRAAGRWIRTERPSAIAGDRLDVLGIPIDFVDMESVVGRVVEAAWERRFFQIATVNLDFLVHSRQDEEVRSILTESDINIPDGAPLVWAARLVGRQGATRVAGADLVPLLMGVAAREGLRVFLLGGENDAASEAAEQLVAWHPQLDVAVFEPPRTSVDDMDNAKILRLLDDAQPHILLVAFGHPKQEKWIYRNRQSLPMVAMGVGCCLDLIAGRQSRAPEWMQGAGLEWGYRLAHEPRRLARRYATDGLSVARNLVPWVISQRLSQAPAVGGGV